MNAFPSTPLPRDANSDLSPIEDEALASAVQTVARERIERAIGAGESS